MELNTSNLHTFAVITNDGFNEAYGYFSSLDCAVRTAYDISNYAGTSIYPRANRLDVSILSRLDVELFDLKFIDKRFAELDMVEL
jgi:hypothetical protein